MFKPVESAMNFIEMEKKWLKHWYENGIVEKYLNKNNNSSKKFSFFDGPITANNPMGVHHAWGRTYKDLWQRFHNLLGHKQRFQNGFDCQGLWVEVEVEKELGIRNKKDIENLVAGDRKASIAKFVDLCKQRVVKYSDIQTEQSKRLAYFMDWDNSYFTMSPENNYMIWYFLKQCYDNGWIYKGLDSVPWCPRCETAISQHEMLTEDYKEVTHESIYFELPIEGRDREFLLVWTTTPWSIPANIAVAVDGKLDYSLVQGTTGDSFWVVKDLVEKVFGKEYKQINKTVKGKELVGLKYKAPFDDLEAVQKIAKENPEKFHIVVATDDNILPITTVEGTGMVHTAVSAGGEDFKLGKKYGLPMIPVIADDASYLPGLGFLTGKNAKKNPRLVLDYLEEKNVVFKIEKYAHRYPACWRCKTELVWKVTDEWYIAMDKKASSEFGVRGSENKTLRERMVEVAKKIKWMPEFGLDRELDWLKNMHDWLISKKNRYWGLALPIWECKKCGNFEVISGYHELKEKSVEGWSEFEGHTPHKPFIDEVRIKCSKCGESMSRTADVGNPWLDAGIIPFSTLIDPQTKKLSYIADKKYFNEWFPADFITESFPGQFKNWFYALIAESTVLENTNPFKTVLGFGTMLDEKEKPFHKSAGNAIEFVEGADKFGADIIRWICSSSNPANNILFGEHKVNDVMRRFYLILWNSYKFFVDYANQDGFADDRHSGGRSDSRIDSGRATLARMTSVLDKWILSRFVWLVRHVEEELKNYNAKDASQEVEKFVSDLSTWYIRRSRERVGVNSEDENDKNNFYKTMEFVFLNLSITLSSFTPFISEEIYTNLTNGKSVHLSDWPDLSAHKVDEDLIHDMAIVREIVEVGHRTRKENNLRVRQPLASAVVSLSKEKKIARKEFHEDYKKLLSQELNVKKIEVDESDKETITIAYDTNITAELKLEGEFRDLIRAIQNERKLKNIKINDPISLMVPRKFEKYTAQIKRKVIASNIVFGDELKVE